MLLARLRSGLCRDLIAGMLMAFALLAGVIDARATTERAAMKGFASPFELCLQSGHGSGGTDTHHDCDACRIPGFALAPVPGVAPMQIARIAADECALPVHRARHDARAFLPDARGPPVRG